MVYYMIMVIIEYFPYKPAAIPIYLCLGITESTVELEHIRPVISEHNASIDDPLIRMTVHAHMVDDLLDDPLLDQLESAIVHLQPPL